ncbi:MULTISPECIES: hypothetical protein [Listeria]|uniref:hypothetical protein n=1 Tax=Listeria TaxID=1637 RepID=UPI00066A0DBC|nr:MULTISPECIES: hypothetical protein [Listeria]KMT61748.1 hypothetical protein X559_1888 [Listeria newyorkensis]
MKKYDVLEFLVILVVASLWSYVIFVLDVVPNQVGVILTIILSIVIYIIVKITSKKRKK